MSDAGHGSATVDGMTITSSTETSDQIKAALAGTEIPPKADATAEPKEPPAEVGDQPSQTPDPAPESEAGKQLAKKRRSLQDRIDEITGEKYATARERDAMRAERDALKAELDTLKRPKAEPQQAASDPRDPEPDPTDLTKYPDGQFDRKYLKDQARWEARQELNARDAQQRQHQALARHQETIHTVATNYSTRMQKALEADPDLQSKIHPDLIAWSPLTALPPGSRFDFRHVIADIIAKSEVPDKLLVHLTEHPELVQRFSTLYPDDLHREMGKLESRLDAAAPGPASEPTPVSRAKPPIKPVGSSPSAADDDPENLPFAEYVKRENAKDRAQGRRP